MSQDRLLEPSFAIVSMVRHYFEISLYGDNDSEQHTSLLPQEFAILAAAKNKYEPNSPFRSWDRGYYVGLVKAQTHDLDARVSLAFQCGSTI
jgi:hypothetical protein